MGGDPSNPYPFGNNVAASAGLFSTLAGVLAGFAFTAIVLLLVTWLADSKGAHHVLAVAGRALVVVFLGMLIECTLYASESSNAFTWGQATSEELILAVGFVGVAVVLFYAVLLMLDAATVVSEPPSGQIRDLALFARSVVCALNLLLLGLIYDNVTGYESARYGPNSPITGIDQLSWILLGCQVVVAAGSMWVIVRRPMPGRYANTTAVGSGIVISTGLGLPIASAIGYVTVDTQLSETATVPPFFVVVILLVVFTTTAGTCAHLVLTRPARITPMPAGRQAGRRPRSPCRVRPR